jgi:soluble lytic murein transglycosylase-like protein
MRKSIAVIACVVFLAAIGIAWSQTSVATTENSVTPRELRAQLLKERKDTRKVISSLRIRLRAARTAVVERPSVDNAIRLASFTFGYSESTVRRIAYCESTFNANAVNRSSGASGVMQFMPSTWRANRYGSAGFSVFDPYANVFGAVYHMSRNGTGAWSCA